MFTETTGILHMLYDMYEKPWTSPELAKLHESWIQESVGICTCLANVCRHFGWAALMLTMDSADARYQDYGYGKRTDEWVAEQLSELHSYLERWDERVGDSRYLVGGELSIADCAIFNVPFSAEWVIEIDMEARYPNFHRYAQ